MKGRVEQIDYLKGVLIVLMVIFHLGYVGDLYPYIKDIVYTFHMSAFLIISGYLVSVQKNAKPFFREMLWIFIPYFVMEVGYVVMSAVLPVRESVAHLSLGVVLEKAFCSPLGPYWYLHTLILCSSVCFLVYKYIKVSNLSRLIILGVCYFVLSNVLGVIALSSAIYFLIGVAVRQGGLNFTAVFRPSMWALLPLVLLCAYPANLDRSTLAGVVITYLMISVLLVFYTYVMSGTKRLSLFLGRNTLLVLLFSPIFTIITKFFVPFFAFDPTGLVFLVVATTFTVAGSVAIGYLADGLGLSRLFFGRERAVR